MAQKKDAPSVADCLRKTLSKCPVWACTFALTLFSLSAVSQTAEDVEDAADFLDASVEMVKSALSLPRFGWGSTILPFSRFAPT